MAKIVVQVYLPQIGKAYDVRIADDAFIYQITMQLSALFAKKRDIAFIPDQNTVLCEATTGKILDENLIVAEAAISNGSRLMLI